MYTVCKNQNTYKHFAIAKSKSDDLSLFVINLSVYVLSNNYRKLEHFLPLLITILHLQIC